MYTKGTILQLQPELLLKHDLFDIKDKNVLLSVITYQLKGDENGTTISATEELNYEMRQAQFKEISEGWNLALSLLKDTVEKL